MVPLLSLGHNATRRGMLKREARIGLQFKIQSSMVEDVTLLSQSASRDDCWGLARVLLSIQPGPPAPGMGPPTSVNPI